MHSFLLLNRTAYNGLHAALQILSDLQEWMNDLQCSAALWWFGVALQAEVLTLSQSLITFKVDC